MSNFFRDPGVRETIESIVVAVMLALMFKAFEAEAYIIPTGSMAPTLRGEHFDIACEQCGHLYQTNCSNKRNDVRNTFCPICRYRTVLKPEMLSDHNSFDGDRILVNKFIYDFTEPERWDVIVFKNPRNAKQNYIKRLCGLPNESLLIENGDLFTFDSRTESFDKRRIARKSPRKIRAMMQLVDDNKHIGPKLVAANWPLRWTPIDSKESLPNWTNTNGPDLSYSIDATKSNEIHWLRYRHIVPHIEDWDVLNGGELPDRIAPIALGQAIGGGLVRDHYSYNELVEQKSIEMFTEVSGFHWVGDLGVEAWVDIQSDTGTLLLETTEGGTHLVCQIDIASGEASLSSSDSNVKFVDANRAGVGQPKGPSKIRGRGKHRVFLMNADDRVFVWIDNRPLVFGGLTYQDYERTGTAVPTYSAADPGDSLPLGVGCQTAKVQVSRMKVWRDVYYTTEPFRALPRPEWDYRVNLDIPMLDEILDSPAKWSSEGAVKLFESRKRTEKDLHQLGEDQFFPMGDNSPASFDTRVWGDPPYVQRDLLLGRALFLYFPHSLNRPVYGIPDFSRMKFIR